MVLILLTLLFAILQKYEFSSKSQHLSQKHLFTARCLRYCKSTSFQANHNLWFVWVDFQLLFAILQKYEFSSKSQRSWSFRNSQNRCLRYCKSTSFQANHNCNEVGKLLCQVVCDTAKVRVFKQITTRAYAVFSINRCLRYCKSTSFQANHNTRMFEQNWGAVVCDTAKVRVFKQITTLVYASCHCV